MKRRAFSVHQHRATHVLMEKKISTAMSEGEEKSRTGVGDGGEKEREEKRREARTLGRDTFGREFLSRIFRTVFVPCCVVQHLHAFNARYPGDAFICIVSQSRYHALVVLFVVVTVHFHIF